MVAWPHLQIGDSRAADLDEVVQAWKGSTHCHRQRAPSFTRSKDGHQLGFQDSVHRWARGR